VELADHYALRSVDNVRGVFRHERDVANIDILLSDLFDLAVFFRWRIRKVAFKGAE